MTEHIRSSNQRAQIRRAEALEACLVAGLDLGDPFGIADQRAADGDEIELVLRHALEQRVEISGCRRLAREGAEEFIGQSDRADADGRRARDLLGPASEVEPFLAIDLREFRLPEAALRAVQDVNAGIDQRLQPVGHQRRSLGEARSIVLLLPLADAQDDREIRTDSGADRGDDLAGKARALLDGGAAITVLALVAARPEELID